MQELELTRKRLVSVWWLAVWRGSVGGALIGVICGVIGGVVAAIIIIGIYGHASKDVFKRAGQIGGFVFTLPFALLWGFTVLRMAFRKRYRDFRIALVPLDTPESVKL